LYREVPESQNIGTVSYDIKHEEEIMGGLKTLDKKNISDVVALTPIQEGLLFHYLKDPQSDFYFEQLSLGISAPVDIKYFQQAWNIVVKTNDMMRTVFRWEKIKTPSQIVLKEHKIEFRYYDLSGGGKDKAKKQLEKIKNKDRREKFDLREVPFRVTLCKLGDENFEAIISNHHILYDGWSNGIILKEFIEAYDKLVGGESLAPTPTGKTKFSEFVRCIQTRDTGKEAVFWKDYLRGLDSGTEIRLQKATGVGRRELGYGFGRYHANIPRDRKTQLETFAGEMNVTFASLLYSAWGVLLQKYNNTDDVVMGTTVAGRSAKLKGIENIVGLFINTLPLRVQAHSHDKTENFLERIDQALKMREEFESASLVDIREYSGIGSGVELFDTVVVIENYPLDIRLKQESRSLAFFIDSYSLEEFTHYNLTLAIRYFDDSDLNIEFIYNKGIFDKDAIVNLSNHFINILEGIESNAGNGKCIHEIELLLPEERQQLLVEFNDTESDYPRNKTIHELFAEKAEQTPDSVAVIGKGYECRDAGIQGNISITYKELNKKSDQLAHVLKKKGILVGSIIAIMMERCVEIIIGILGILKAGGAYLPIDPTYPVMRKVYMLENSGAKALLTQTNFITSNLEVQRALSPDNIVCLDSKRDFPEGISNLKSMNESRDTDTVYVIYTSGTTGKPKGVVLAHFSLINFIYSMYRNYKNDFSPADKCLGLTNFCFDVSVCEIFMPLVFGASIVLLSYEKVFDPVELAKVVVERSITFTYLPPGLLTDVFENLKSYGCKPELNKMLVGVEPIRDNVLENYISLNPSMLIVNGYGPTEASICATAYRYCSHKPEGKRVPIGSPLSNTIVVLLDKYGHLVPVGVPGELFIAGDGLAKGYLNNPELTAEKFDQDLWDFLDYRDKKKKGRGNTNKIYKTGDLARWLPDGDIEFVGRIDLQVKIRGFRIEPGEIESQLLTHDDIKEAVVILRQDQRGAHNYLNAYFVSISGSVLAAADLREYLSGRLPDYMIPSYFIQIEKIPLTPNGKVDRKALPEPDIISGKEYIAPRYEWEQKQVEIWSDVLGIEKEKISIDDNFFELGGHSLKATALMMKIHKELGIKISLTDIFESPSIRGLSTHIKGAVEEKFLAIEPVEEKDYYPLSPAQRRLYVLQQMETRGIVYNTPAVFILAGKVNKDRLEETFARLIHRHENFRTIFIMVDGDLCQRVAEKEAVEFAIESHSAERKEKHHTSFITNFIRPFDLSRAPLLRVGLIRVEAKKYILMVDMHHIISDGMSMVLIVQEFMNLYADEGVDSFALRLQYKDYAEWQNNKKHQEAIKQQRKYWEKEFTGETPVLDLPCDYARPVVLSFEGNTLYFEIDKEQTIALKTLALEEGATLYMVLLAIYMIVLSKLSNQQDILVGAPVAGRRHADLAGVVGMFVNTLVLRNSPRRENTFTQFLSQVKVRTLSAFAHQDYPFDELVEVVSLTRDTSRNPLFDTVFVMQNMDLPELEIPALTLKPFNYKSRISKFDLTLRAFEMEERLSAAFEFCTRLFKKKTVERFIRYFKQAVSAILIDPGKKISELEIISEEEKRQLLYDFNDTEAQYPFYMTVHELFTQQVERMPNSAAIVGAAQSVGAWGTVPLPMHQVTVTYNELNEKSDHLARILMERGVRPDTIVALMIGRTIEIIIGILGILKAGCAYLPIDPDYPEDRKKYMLTDSNTKILVSEVSKVSEGIEMIDLPLLIAENKDAEPTCLTHFTLPPHLCYIIYTSGTTGRPKGVMIEHRNIVRLMVNDRFFFDFDNRDVWTMFHSYCFDFSVWEMYGALLYGGKLVVIPRWMARDTRQFLDILKARQVTVLNQTPSAFYNLVNEELFSASRGLSLRYVIFGGEALAPGKLKQWKQRYPNTRLINMFGITETTVHVTFKEITDKEIEGNIGNIGGPIPTLTTYIVDNHQKLLPIGVAGELCIGGDGVGRGYLNQPQLTVEKFIESPYDHDERWYRSGDLSRFMTNGEMVYLGRIDHQVQLRGFRVELGEIESRLLSCQHVKEAVVIDREDKTGDNYLCAYIIPGTAGGFESADFMAEELKQQISEALPDYMIPSFFVSLEKIPLTPNGKVDRRALPVPLVETVKDYTPPRDDVEKTLVEIWSEVLGIGRDVISIDSNFFQLGGHSIKATSVVSKILKAFDVDLPLVEIFTTSTVRGLAELIKKAKKEKYISIESIEKKYYYALSSAQRRLYVLQQLDLESTVYNIPVLAILKGPLERVKLAEIFRKLIYRHESLRTSFVVIEGEPVQWIHKSVGFDIEQLAAAADKNIYHNFVRAFNLSQAPLFRVGMKEIENRKHLLAVDMHHIITDGASMGVFIKEFMSLYNGEELEPLRIQYKDFSDWQNSRKEEKSILRQEKYWLREFEGEIPVLHLPLDSERPMIQDFAGNTLAFTVGREETEKLRNLATVESTTLFTVLLSIFNVLLAKTSGQEDIVVGSPIAGRRHIDLDRIIGMFVNTLALRNYPAGEKTFRIFLREVRDKTLNAQENQEYLFENLIERLTPNIERDVSRNPLFDVMFVLQNVHISEVVIPPVKLSPYPYKSRVSKFDLTFICEENEPEGNLSFSVEYSTKLFKEGSIKRFIGFFKNTLSFALDKPDLKIEEIEIISDEEKKKLLYDFNDTESDYPGDKTIHELFTEQVERMPGSAALVGVEQSIGGRGTVSLPIHNVTITYKELNRKSNQLANVLREKGIGPGSIVGLMGHRSLEMVIGVLGILKSGAAYLPIDPAYPEERIDFIVKDSNTGIVLSEVSESGKVSKEIEVVNPGELSEEFSTHLNHLTHLTHPNHLCYVIYTSGSTGKPKGVTVHHQPVVNILFNLNKRYPLRANDAYLLKTSFVFDVSVTELFGWFAGKSGGRLVILEKGAEKSPRRILDTIQRYRVTHLNFVPSMFNAFVETLDSWDAYKLAYLKYIFLAGEALWVELVKKFQRLDTNVLLENLYGPTEAVIYASGYSLSDWNKAAAIPIGKPLGNIRLYILNSRGKLQPLGVPGELYISGAGLACGYLNNPELTAEKFDQEEKNYKKFCGGPGGGFSKEPPGRRGLYKTGDLARWLADGNIEFLGRIDFQVKVRGFRIELGEIENRLFTHPNVKETVVTAREEKGERGEKYLCAYIVLHDKNAFRELELRDYLLAELPDYMVPAYFVVLERMPLSSSGKVDRKVLPETDITGSAGTGYVPPANEMEMALVDIWSDVLRLEKEHIGIHDNFFRLGGHSLKAAVLAGRIHKAFSVEVPIAELFKAPTVKGICSYIDRTHESFYSSIDPVEEKEYYLLSPAQKRLYVVNRLDENSTGYNIPYAVELKGDLDLIRLEDTFKQLIKQHESLRTSFEMVDDELVQRVKVDVEFEIECYDELTSFDIHQFVRPFDLSHSSLLRAGLKKFKLNKYIMIVDMHHIISDGMSMNILIREFTALYRDADAGKGPAGLRLQYKDYAEWQNSDKVREAVSQQGAYWLKEFAGEIPVLDLPMDFARPAMQSFEGEMVKFGISSEHMEKLKVYAQEENATLFMLLLSMYNVLFFKLSGQEDIVTGTPVAGRRHIDLSWIIGIFINTLALRNFPGGEKTFGQFLDEVRERTLAAFENQVYPFEDLVEQVEAHRDTSRNPLFDVMLVLQNMEMQELQIPGLELKEYIFENRKSKFDMTLTVLEKDQALDFILTYSSDLFKRKTIERYIGYFKRIVLDILENPHKKIAEIELLSSEEKRQLIIDFNDTAESYPRDKTIHELFAEQVECTPDSIALSGSWQLAVGKRKKTQITYGVLNEKANQLAHMLRDKGVGSDSIVGLMVERSLEMIIGLLGILKAGGAYLPIDPDYPQRRITYMLKDSSARILLSEVSEESKVSGGIEVIDLPSLIAENEDGEHTYLTHPTHPTHLCYIIYTSGSTGRPKGVGIHHFSVVNLTVSHIRHYNITRDDRILLFSPICFDASIEQIFITLFSGLCLFIVDKDTLLDNKKFEEFIASQGITHLNAVPSFLNAMKLKNPYKLKRILSGGDVCPVPLAQKWSRHCEFYNKFGPTETTVNSIKLKVSEIDERWARLPVGKPNANTTVYLFDKWMKHTAPGIVGELYIGGDGVARGYINRPELTAEKFFHLTFNTKNVTLYRSGDLARWLSDGNLEFLGRIDNQVKIRGFRIELGEIESRLLRHKAITEVVVISKESETGDRYLCAYFVTVNDKTLNAVELKETLSRELPDYAVPPYFVRIDKIPLTPTGKLDRRALPKPQAAKIGEEYAAPANQTELKMASLWSNLLEIERVGMNDNFFSLGGHSLKAIILTSRIHKAFNVGVTLAELFKLPTVRGLSQYIKDREADPFASIQPVEEKDYYILSSAQKRLYFLHHMDENSTNYNIPYGIVLEGKVDKRKLEDTFIKLINRHESLRTSFALLQEEPVQRIHEGAIFKIEFYWVERPSAQGSRPNADIIRNFICPFDLSQIPLMRVGLAQLEKNKHLLMIDMHHIISDGISCQLLINEFTAFYDGEELPALKIQYNDFAEWQTSKKKREALADQEAYWKEQFRDEVPVLELPTDYPRPAIQSFEGSSVTFEIESEKLEAFKSLALEQGTTLYMVLLALYNILLSKLSNQEDIIIGTPTAGRGHADLEQIIGMFVNTLVLRNFPAGEKTYTSFLNEIKERTLVAFDNQDFQYEDLVEEVVLTRDASRNPLFDTMFVLQNTDMADIEISALKVTPYEQETKTSKFDLLLSGLEVEEKLLLTLEYSTKLFKAVTIVRFILYFKNIVSTIIENPAVKIDEIEILTEEEKNRLLYDFNESETDYPGELAIHELFTQQVEQTPDSAAVIGMGHAITYRKLNEKSNQLAYGLRCKGVRPDSIVGLMVDRSIGMIIGIMGILKAGGAYLPIDPDYPQERIEYMLADSAAKVLVITSNLVGEFEKPRSWEVEKVFLEKVLETPECFPKSLNLSTSQLLSSSNLAYVIYTSGTTGKPKGVLVEHRSVVNLLLSLQRDYPLLESDAYLLKTSYLFDVSVSELFGWYPGGGKLVVLEPEGHKDPAEIIYILQQHGITHINFVPSMFAAFVEYLHYHEINQLGNLKYIFLAGEALLPELVNRFRRLNTGIIVENLYGPTETVVYASRYPLSLWEGVGIVPIGKPLSNVQLYILARNNRLQPVGVPGELCIAGDGISRGYLNRPELTAKKFILIHSSWIADRKVKEGNVAAKSSGKLPMSYLYKTGDLARWMPDGNIEFLERMDHQVKIRGFRIELGEIENQLIKHPDIGAVVVVTASRNVEIEGKEDKYLCAYVVPASGAEEKTLDSCKLKEFLTQKLPDYMVPSFFISMEKIPLTRSGKLDRNALPAPETVSPGVEYTAPRDAVEAKLAEIWSDILDVEPIGIHNNFFKLGGHSLKATTLTAKIYKTFSVKVTLANLFKKPTIKGLAEFIKKETTDEFIAVEPVEKREYYLLSPAQKRLCILQQTNAHDVSYNMPQVMELEGEVVKSRLEDTLKKLIARHDSFRTSFETQQGELVQRVYDHVEFEVERLTAAANEDNITDIIHSFVRSFDLSQPPLLRVGLINLDKHRHILIVDIHHIVTDGSSLGIFVQEFMALQVGQELPPLRVHYKDFSAWMNSKTMKESIEKQEKYWLSEFEGVVPVLQLYTDDPGLHSYSQALSPGQWSLEGKRITAELDSAASGGLKKLANEEGVTLYMVLLAIYNILLFKLSGQEDIVVGTVTAGRSHPDLQPVMGMFVNTLALRSYPRRNTTFRKFLREVRELTLEAFANQAYPFEELAEKVAIDTDSRRNPVFDVMFTLQNLDIPKVEIPGLTLKPYAYENVISKFDLTLFGVEEDNRLFFIFEYRTQRFNERIISEFVSYFKDIIPVVLENRDIKLADIEVSIDFSDSQLESDIIQEFSGDFGF
jgi:tyrocidine synthetase-3